MQTLAAEGKEVLDLALAWTAAMISPLLLLVHAASWEDNHVS